MLKKLRSKNAMVSNSGFHTPSLSPTPWNPFFNPYEFQTYIRQTCGCVCACVSVCGRAGLVGCIQGRQPVCLVGQENEVKEINI